MQALHSAGFRRQQLESGGGHPNLEHAPGLERITPKKMEALRGSAIKQETRGIDKTELLVIQLRNCTTCRHTQRSASAAYSRFELRVSTPRVAHGPAHPTAQAEAIERGRTWGHMCEATAAGQEVGAAWGRSDSEP